MEKHFNKKSFVLLKNNPFKKFPFQDNGTDLTLIKNWIPLLKFLRILGEAPLSIQQTNHNIEEESSKSQVNSSSWNYYKIKTQWFPLGLFSIIIWGLFRSLQMFLTFVNTEENPQPLLLCWNLTSNFSIKHKATPTEILIASVPPYLLRIWNLIEWITILITLPYFVKFVNNWQTFGEIYKQFQHKIDGRNQNLNRNSLPRVKWLLLFVNFPGLILTLALIAWKHYNSIYLNCGNGFLMIRDIALSISLFVHHLVALVEHTKIIFMYISVCTALMKIGENIQETPKNMAENRNSMSIIVKQWQIGYKLVKKQVHLIESSQSVYELLFLSYLVLILTIQLFLTLSPIFRGENLTNNLLLLIENSASLIIGMIRLGVKCHYAEQITYQEKLMVEELLNWEFVSISEVKNFADSIIWNPTKIVYGSVLTVNKRLILSIGSQILTYIIILLQFQLNFAAN